MNAQQRRQAILERIRAAQAPISATALAGEFCVSRQIVVGDVALLRAGGEDIQATPRGYVSGTESAGVTAVLACVHGAEDMGRELNVMVDHGCEVLDVVVEHPIYGQLTGQLHLRSRHDVEQFLRRARDARPLSHLTGGIHLHTVRCPDEETLQRVTDALYQEGFLLTD